MNALIVALLSLGGVHYDTSIGSCMPLSGGTFTSAVCWTDGTQSVCVDSPAAGDFQIYGSGGTNNEDLTIDTETTANVLGLSSSTGVTDIDLGTLQLLFGVGATLKPGSTDDVLCVEESGDAADQFCMKTFSDILYLYQGDEATYASMILGNLTAFSSGGVESSTASGGTITLDDSTAPGVNDALAGTIYFQSADDGSNNAYFAQISGYTEEVTDGDEDGSLLLRTMNNGSMTTVQTIDATDGVEAVSFAWPLIVGGASDPADSGDIRLDNARCISWEANPAGTDHCLQVDTSGRLYYAGTAFATLMQGNNVLNAAAGQFYWSGRSELVSPADGQVTVRQSDDSTGFVLDGLTANTLTVKDQAGTGSGSISFGGALTMSGVVNPGDSNYTTIATSNWIAMATACTASRTITLDDDHCVTGRVITITDAGCGAAANNIIVDPEGTSLIQGAAGTYTMSTDDESIDVGCVDGSGGAGAKKWWVK